jgi:hypothetical protein
MWWVWVVGGWFDVLCVRWYGGCMFGSWSSSSFDLLID